jgi:Uncharacterized protein conserved in bacteria
MRKIVIILVLLFCASFLLTEIRAQIQYEQTDTLYNKDVTENLEFNSEANTDTSYFSLDTLSIMTYNLWQNHGDYSEHARVITNSGADVVALQELKGSKFKKLKKETGLQGVKYGLNIYNGLLWKPSLGKPKVKHNLVMCWKEKDKFRAYSIAEFNDFVIVFTHYSLSSDGRIKITEKILKEDIVKNYQKPVYVAGDINESPHNGKAIALFRDAGFEVLNDTTRYDNGRYHHNTRYRGEMIDLILEKNTNPSREIINRGIPADADTTYTISDHLPYVVRVKL